MISRQQATEKVAQAALELMALNQTNNPDAADLYVSGVYVNERRRAVVVTFAEVVDSTAVTLDRTVDISDLFDMHYNGD